MADSIRLDELPGALSGTLIVGDGRTWTATEGTGNTWPASTRLRIINAAGTETVLTPVIAGTLATWTVTVAETAALRGTKVSGSLHARITTGAGDALRPWAAGRVSIVSAYVGSGAAQSLGTVTLGPAGQSAYELAVFNGFVGTEPEWLATFTTAADGYAVAAAASQAAAAASAAAALGYADTARGRWPVVQIALDGGLDPTTTTDYIAGTYTITATDGGIIHSGAVNVRGRGNSTWALEKKPWRVNFGSKTSPLGMSANQKNWGLLANHFDDSKLNNAFALELGARMSGLAWTPQYRAVELVLNGTFRGVYQLGDLVKLETGRVPGTAPTALGDGSDGTWLMEASNAESPTTKGEGLETPGFATSIYGQWIIWDTPESPTEGQAAYIAAAVGAFETALSAGDWAGWKVLADATSFADWWLINELIRNFDSAGGWSSCKMWKSPDAGAVVGQIHMGPLWDQDLSLGLGWESETSPVGWWTRTTAWIDRMWQDADWRALAQVRWAALLAGIDDMGGYEAWLDQHSDQLGRAIRDDDARWTQTTYTTFETDRRKRWLAARIAWLSAQIGAPIDPVTATVTPTV